MYELMMCIIQKLQQYVAFPTKFNIKNTALQITYNTLLLKCSEINLF